MYTETLSKPVTIGAESAPEICLPLTVPPTAGRLTDLISDCSQIICSLMMSPGYAVSTVP
jgi:hypothetical protein